MTITAKYSGVCRKCGQPIEPGQKIEWNRGEKPYHTECPKLAEPGTPLYKLSLGEGYASRWFAGWQGREVTRNMKHRIEKGEPEFLFVLSTSSEYFREDGMSFGVGDEQGHIYYATCREATEEEAAPLKAEMAAAQARREADKKARGLHRDIMEHGERPDGWNTPEGEVIDIAEGQNIYGGGLWFVIGDEWVWAIKNNGADGDCWDWNNVRTGGAGAVGKRVPLSGPLEEEIRTACLVAYLKEEKMSANKATVAKHEWICSHCGERINPGDEIYGNENALTHIDIFHAACLNRPDEMRYAVDGWRIRVGKVRHTSCGTGVDWGEGVGFGNRGYATREEAEAELAQKHAKLDEHKRVGASKWGNRECAFIIRRGAIHEVRFGERGDLMSAQGYGVIAHWDAEWPKLYDSRESAKHAAERIREQCAHSWTWLSHEERECRKCGEIEFIPDLD